MKPAAELDETRAEAMPPRRNAFKGQVTRAIPDMLGKSDVALDGLSITKRLQEEREPHLADVDVAGIMLPAAKDAVDAAVSGDRVSWLSPADADMVTATSDAPAPASEALRRHGRPTRHGR